MKIIYKLEINYFGNDEYGNKIDRNDTFLYESNDSLANRESVFKDYKNYDEVFNDAIKFGKLKMNWIEILNKNLKEFHIPSMNIYYCENEYNEENEIVLFGSLLESFEERMQELVDEAKLYEEKLIPFDYENIIDIENNIYKVIKGSLIKSDDRQFLK